MMRSYSASTEDDIREILRAEMGRQRIKQGELAAAIGVSTTTMGKLMHGRSRFRLEFVMALRERLGIAIVLDGGRPFPPEGKRG